MNNPIQPSQLHEICQPAEGALDPEVWSAGIGNDPCDEVQVSPESQMMLTELTRLTAEAVHRVNGGQTLAGLGSLFAVQPLVSNLLGLISKDLQEHAPTFDNDAMPDGVYL